MGAYVSMIKDNAYRKNTSSLLNVPLSRVRDFHASFKSICDNFSMDLSEFEHIFGASESAFVIWDTDNNGLIDSLELFSGITLFSDTKFEDKIRFLFDLFDFNELDSLALVDIEFMIYCCISASYKIFSISAEISAQDISEFAEKQFSTDVRITVVKLLEQAKKSNKVTEFFDIIKMENPNSGSKNTSGQPNLQKLVSPGVTIKDNPTTLGGVFGVGGMSDGIKEESKQQ